MKYIQRKERLFKKAYNLGYNVILAVTPPNIFYLTGFWGNGLVMMFNDKTVLFTSSIEKERAIEQSFNCDIMTVKDRKNILELSGIINSKISCCDAPIGLISDHLEKLKNKINFIPKLFFDIRRRKDEEEIRAIEKGAKNIDNLFKKIEEIMKPGLTERQIAAELIREIVLMNSDLACSPDSISPLIIASGPNGSYPHAGVSDRCLQIGDLVVVDLTIRYKAYVTDATRTFAIGRSSKEKLNAYEGVKESQLLGIKSLSIGVKTGEIDKVVREELDKRGYGSNFIHSTGHGVGLDIHEPPWLRKNGLDILKNNDIVTVEPGIYLKKKYGIRIEDTIHIGNNIRQLTKYSHDLIELG
jgi:Xaa-Pro aminopeptidase/Xaa-Pro dipeptidase